MFLDRQMSLPGLELDARSRYLPLHLSRVLRRSCGFTPFSEALRTSCTDDTSIDDAKSKNPRMRGFLHGTKLIAREKGIRGFFQGFVPTTARQAANSAVRFGSYTSLKQFAQGYVAPGEKLGSLSTFGLGAVAGTITVYVIIMASHGHIKLT